MENLFKVEKKEGIVLPSGVKAVIKGLEGKHQADITVQDNKKRARNFKKLLRDCIVSLGENDDEVTLDDVDALLSFDRKYLLWRIRKLSNEDTGKFIFDYEFPTDGERKLKQRYEVIFDNESFPITPAIWVRDEIIADLRFSHGNDLINELSYEYKEVVNAEEFPVMFESYEEMLNQHYEVNMVLPECKVSIFWHLATGKDETRMSNAVETNSHSQLKLHEPKYLNKELSVGDKKVVQPVPMDDLCNMDIEALRKSIMITEGNVDSMIVVKSDDDSSKIAHLDLLQTPAFFFASLAL